jgi:hypothetical protein
MACPAIPSVAPRSCAIGVSRLTGMNSEAISKATHIVIDPTALQAADRAGRIFIVFVCMKTIVWRLVVRAMLRRRKCL